MTRTNVLAALAVLALACALAPMATAANTANLAAGGDQRFVMAASAAGMAEVNFGKLAAKQASSAEVRKFGQQMVDDHTKANKELNDLAFNKKWNLAANMDRDHQAEFDRLSKIEGADFDREYLRWQVKDHESVLSLFEDEAKNGDDPQLKEWCNKTLPTLREHLKEVRTLADKFKAGR
jgi:putative membrane protein